MTSDLRIGSENEQDHISLIRNSHFFDSNWYYFENDDVSQTQIDAALHYYYNGWKEHRSPSYYFDNDAYMRDAGLTYSMNINPIVHYILIGTVLGLKLRCLATSHRRWPKAASRDSS
jgi:hypothetical protein